MKSDMLSFIPAARWLEAWPLGNGHIGAMAVGGFDSTVFVLNDDTLYAGRKLPCEPADAASHLDEVRRLLFEGRNGEAP